MYGIPQHHRSEENPKIPGDRMAWLRSSNLLVYDFFAPDLLLLGKSRDLKQLSGSQITA